MLLDICLYLVRPHRGFSLGQPKLGEYFDALTCFREECQIDKWCQEVFFALALGMDSKLLWVYKHNLGQLFCWLGVHLADEDGKQIIRGRVDNFDGAWCS